MTPEVWSLLYFIGWHINIDFLIFLIWYVARRNRRPWGILAVHAAMLTVGVSHAAHCFGQYEERLRSWNAFQIFYALGDLVLFAITIWARGWAVVVPVLYAGMVALHIWLVLAQVVDPPESLVLAKFAVGFAATIFLWLGIYHGRIVKGDDTE